MTQNSPRIGDAVGFNSLLAYQLWSRGVTGEHNRFWPCRNWFKSGRDFHHVGEVRISGVADCIPCRLPKVVTEREACYSAWLHAALVQRALQDAVQFVGCRAFFRYYKQQFGDVLIVVAWLPRKQQARVRFSASPPFSGP